MCFPAFRRVEPDSPSCEQPFPHASQTGCGRARFRRLSSAFPTRRGDAHAACSCRSDLTDWQPILPKSDRLLDSRRGARQALTRQRAPARRTDCCFPHRQRPVHGLTPGVNSRSRVSTPTLASMLREPEVAPRPGSPALDLGALSLRCMRHARWLGLPDIRAQAVWQLALRRSKIGGEVRLDSPQQRDFLQQWFFVLDQSLTGLQWDSAMPMTQARLAFLRVVVGMPLQDIADCLQMPLPTAGHLARRGAIASPARCPMRLRSGSVTGLVPRTARRARRCRR